MKARKYAEVARLGAKMLRGVRLSEDDDSNEPGDAGELVRQIMTDLTRGSMVAASNQTIDMVGDTATGSFEIGVPEGLDGDRSSMVKVRVEVGGADIGFFVNGAKVGQCDADLNRYPEVQRQVAKAIDAARMEVVNKTGEYGETPNYAGYDGMGGPYG